MMFFIFYKGNTLEKEFLESSDSAISRFPMTLMNLMASLHQGPKVFFNFLFIFYPMYLSFCHLIDFFKHT
jgi:hypothetical protein